MGQSEQWQQYRECNNLGVHVTDEAKGGIYLEEVHGI